MRKCRPTSRTRTCRRRYRLINPTLLVGVYVLDSIQQQTIREADVVISFLSTTSGIDGSNDAGETHDRTTLNLPRGQAELTNAILDLNPNTAVWMQIMGIAKLPSSFNPANQDITATMWVNSDDCLNSQFIFSIINR